MVKEIAGQEEFLLTSIIKIEHCHKIQKEVSCEIEHFVETHLFKLCEILQSRVLRVSHVTSSNMLVLVEGKIIMSAVELSECRNKTYMTMDIYATLFILVGHNIINSSMLRDS